MKTRHASPPVAPVEAPSMLRFRRCMIVIFLLLHGSFCKILACNLSRYCICLSYSCYTCDLSISGTRIEALVSSSQNRGVTLGYLGTSFPPVRWRQVEGIVERRVRRMRPQTGYCVRQWPGSAGMSCTQSGLVK
jgi:hypothetical protein